MPEKPQPLISVCLPLYGTEPYLAQCLNSVLLQDFNSFEIIVVSDASRGKDALGHKAGKIIRLTQAAGKKERKKRGLSPVHVKFLENHENHGILEVRRTLCNEACGKYIAYVDSDDELADGALSAFARALEENPSCDIIHGFSQAGFFSKEGSFIPAERNAYSSIQYGRVQGHQIFRDWLCENKISGVLWGKLIKRELLLKVFSQFPYTECNMAEDFITFFFASLFSSLYLGIKDQVYHYRLADGISTGKVIDSIDRWKKVASCASVFTVVSQWTENHKEEYSIAPDEMDKLRYMARYFLANNITQMKSTVIPELQEEARRVLCDYWGQGFVEKIEAAIN